MSVVALHLYEKLNEAANDKERSKAIVDAFSELEERYPNLKDAATRLDLSETELRLQKEIEHVRLEIKTVESNLQKEIEQVRLEIKTVESNLQKEIEQVRLEIKTVESNLQKEIDKTRIEIEKIRSEVKTVEVNLTKELHKHTLWVISGIGSIIMAIKLLDWLISHL
jgi:DNA repair exonuclease SbcCD ATPase subunit